MCPEGCLFCKGVACRACCLVDSTELPVGSHCPHDNAERHHGMTPIASRVPTKPMPPIPKTASIVVELADGSDLAEFLEALAQKLRAQGSVKITIE